MKSWMPFEWIAALRFLAEGRMQTAFIVVGASIGVAVIVFMSAILQGMQANIIRRSLLSQPHIVVEPAEEVARPLRGKDPGGETALVQKRTQRLLSIDQWQRLRDEIRAVPGVNVVTPTVVGPAFAVRGEANRSVSVTGIEPEEFVRIVPLPEKVVAGTWRLAGTDVLIGTELARDLGVVVGDKLRFATARGTDLTLTVTGLFDLGSRGVNERNVYVALRTAQDLLDLPGGCSDLDVTVLDIWQAEEIARKIASRVGLDAQSWIRTNQQLFVALNAQTISNSVLRLSVGISVALGIASVLVVSVVQKSREIGILRAMGATRRQVMSVFLIQGGIVGLVGSFAGSAMAALFLHAWTAMFRNPDGTPLFMLQFDPVLVAWAAGVATLTGLAAAVTPARRAANLDPAEAIRA
ncbi:MAG TPA: ABC transporter permease [Usitatibacter sp.]|nr:ABC transporter permease [Usitatibacter sp.]